MEGHVMPSPEQRGYEEDEKAAMACRVSRPPALQCLGRKDRPITVAPTQHRIIVEVQGVRICMFVVGIRVLTAPW